MTGLTMDEFLFYGGMLCAAAACIGELICLCMFLIRKRRLKIQLEKEYGERK